MKSWCTTSALFIIRIPIIGQWTSWTFIILTQYWCSNRAFTLHIWWIICCVSRAFFYAGLHIRTKLVTNITSYTLWISCVKVRLGRALIAGFLNWVPIAWEIARITVCSIRIWFIRRTIALVWGLIKKSTSRTPRNASFWSCIIGEAWLARHAKMFFCIIMSISRTIIASWLINKLPFRTFYTALWYLIIY